MSRQGQYLKRVQIYTAGPGYATDGGWTTTATDTFTVDIAEIALD